MFGPFDGEQVDVRERKLPKLVYFAFICGKFLTAGWTSECFRDQHQSESSKSLSVKTWADYQIGNYFSHMGQHCFHQIALNDSVLFCSFKCELLKSRPKINQKTCKHENYPTIRATCWLLNWVNVKELDASSFVSQFFYKCVTDEMLQSNNASDTQSQSQFFAKNWLKVWKFF